VAKGSEDAYWEKGRRGPEIPFSSGKRISSGKRSEDSEDYRGQSAPSPQGRRPGEILQGRGAKALEGSVPEVPPPRTGRIPGPAGAEPSLERPGREMGRCGYPPPGPGTEGLRSRGQTLSPPRHEGIWCPSVLGRVASPPPGGSRGASPVLRGWGRSLPHAR
jgi:hypothetical protein